MKLVRVLEKEQQFVSAFEDFAGSPDGSGAPWLSRLRQAAIQRFAEVGFPSRRDEAWKYFHLTPQTVASFRVQPTPSGEVDQATVASFFPLGEGARLVFVDGRYRSELSTLTSLPPGVQVGDLSAELKRDDGRVQRALSHWASLESRFYAPDHAFGSLNTAFFVDGAWVFLPKGVEIETPIELLFYSTQAAEGRATHVRNVIVAEPGSRGAVIEIHAGEDSEASFHNVLTDVILGEGARLDHTKIQRENHTAYHLGLLRATQQRDSHFETGFFSFGGNKVRHEVEVRLLGEGCECGLNGLYVIDGDRHVDNTTTLHHAKPHCNSREVYKGVLADRANGAFTGKIFVHEQAQKTDAKQSNDGLLLSTDAVLNARPNLEIYADDVRCTHGATVGQLNSDALFYLQTRGISRAEARRLLTRAFASEVIESVSWPRLRESLETLLRENLPEGEGRA